MLLAVILSFFIGYNSMISMQSACNAQSIPGAPPIIMGPGVCTTCICTPGCIDVDICVVTGTSPTMKNSFWQMFDQTLKRLTYQTPPWTGPQGGAGDDGFISGMVDLMVQALMTRLNTTELDLIDWWDTMWYYNLLPAMKGMTRQINTAVTQQVENFQGGMDAFQQNEVNNSNNANEMKAAQQQHPSENACVAAMAAGGGGRATNFSKAMRQGWQEEASIVRGTNKKMGMAGTYDAESSAAAQMKDDANVFETTFCDPNDNGGHNVCQGAPNPAYYNADTTVNKTLFNKLTIPVDDPTNGPTEVKAVSAVLNNLTTDPTGDPVPLNVLQTPAGQEKWMARRSYLARYNAIRAVPQMVAGWRMPGSKLGTWVKELRQDASVPITEIADNPSYKEVLHAVSIDRFNSGKFANNLIADQSAIDMEKLTLSSFYLMQLRDYYELLEREALTLSVQVSLMAEQIPKPVAPQVMR